MRIYVDDIFLFEISETQAKVLKNELHEDIFEEDMKRRLEWVLTHKYEQCFESLKKEWEPKLAAKGLESIPTNPDAFAQLVFSQPEYKGRKDRDIVNSQSI